MTAEKERKLNKIHPKSITEAPKAHAYYHIEYNLLPDDSEPMKVDLVMYGLMAKVYMDNETKVTNNICFFFLFHFVKTAWHSLFKGSTINHIARLLIYANDYCWVPRLLRGLHLIPYLMPL